MVTLEVMSNLLQRLYYHLLILESLEKSTRVFLNFLIIEI